ncbi:hypothetical protein [Aliagarivorans marinus]|uniref:hypothetical protein n=1 Tax=Aliagarivorans marinus TaxID=561965 RepID=UPI00047DBD69|nr:hypothetical protein [Aliagarivorans marinus]
MPTGEHRAALDFLKVKNNGRARRNSISQADTIHNATLRNRESEPLGFTSSDLEQMRRKRGDISATHLLSFLHPSQQKTWHPNFGGGRHQIRTGRNFEVPDSEHPGQHFTVRIHTNDNTILDKTRNAHSNAVVRIQRSQDGRFLMGGRSHAHLNGHDAWSGRGATEDEINAAHIPSFVGRRR